MWVLAASPTWHEDADITWLPAPDKIAAADGGTTLAVRLGLQPDLIIGDLDSSDPQVVQTWRDAGIDVRLYNHFTKNETDTELAVLAALEWHPSRIYILGGTGGRLDHSLANVLMLTHPALAATDVRLIEGRQEAYLAHPGSWTEVQGQPGDTVTLLPIGGDATGVVLEGFYFPLNGETLPEGHGRGVSNEIASPGARLRFDAGQLLVVVLHGGSR